jgi:hypothetical protein
MRLASTWRMDSLAIDVATPVPLRVVCTTEQWQLITTITQPALANQLARVRSTLTHPDEVRESSKDPTLLLYYRRIGPRWMAGVVKRGKDRGFLIAAYAATSVKPGARLWPR